MKHLMILSLLLLWSASAFAQYQGTAPTVYPPATPPQIAGRTTSPTPDDLLNAVRQERTIQVDDVVSVEAYGVKDFYPKKRVPLNGNLDLPLIGPVPVLGLTASDAAALIQQKLIDAGMMLHAQIDLNFVSQPSATVTISGEVNKPGVFPAFGDQTLESYLALAEGLKSTGSSTVTLIRGSYPPIPIPLDADGGKYSKIRLFQGDQIVCPKVGVFYVVGAVKNQNAYPLKNSTPTTVFDALAIAGGMGYEADSADAQIVRNGPNGRVVVAVNLKKLRVTRDSDTILQPDDVLYVPTHQVKAAIKGGGAAVIITLATSLVYATHN